MGYLNIHIHKYIRIKIGKTKRIEYKCAIPGCVHHIREELIDGRQSLCNRCSKPFFMDKKNMKLAKPHCDECTMSNKQSKINKIAELVGKL
jgi:hypothetical protein